MASNPKFAWTTKCNNGNAYQMIISQNGYAGSSDEPEAPGSPIKLTYNTLDNFIDPMRTSQCKVSLESMTEQQYNEFFNSDFADYQLQIIQQVPFTGDVVWTGWLKAEEHSEEWVDPPYSIDLTFVDGLAELKKQEFKASGGALFTGQMHVIEILRHCLNGLGEDYAGPLDIVEVVNIYDDGMTDGTANSPLKQLFTDSGSYRVIKNKIQEGMSKYDVIYELLYSLNCHIFQKDSQWHVVRAFEYTEDVLTFRSFAPSVGSESSTTQQANGTISHKADSVGAANPATDEFVMLGESGIMGERRKIGGVIYTYLPNKYTYVNSAINANAIFSSEMGIDPDENLPLLWRRSAPLTNAQCEPIHITDVKRIKAPVAPRSSRPGRLLIDVEKDDIIKKVTGDEDPPDWHIFFDDSLTSFDSTRFIDAQDVEGTYVTTSDKLAIFLRHWEPISGQRWKMNSTVQVTDVGSATDYFLQSNGTWWII